MSPKSSIVQILYLAIYVTMSSTALLLVKLGSGENLFSFVEGSVTLHLNIKFLIGLLLYILSFCLFTFKIVNFAQLNIIYPVAAGMGLAITFVLSVVVLHETVSIHKIIAFLMIVAGCILIQMR